MSESSPNANRHVGFAVRRARGERTHRQPGCIGSLAMGVKHRLLDTPAERVPHEFAQEVIDFCKPIPAVTAAYVGLTEITEDFQNPYEQLAAAFELAAEDDTALQS